MTKKEKREIIYKASRLIAADLNTLTCMAIEHAISPGQSSPLSGFYPLTHEYQDFYDKRGEYEWGFSEIPGEAKQERILALLFFAEAGL